MRHVGVRLAPGRPVDHQRLRLANLLRRLHGLPIRLREQRVARNDARPEVGRSVGVRRLERLAVALAPPDLSGAIGVLP